MKVIITLSFIVVSFVNGAGADVEEKAGFQKWEAAKKKVREFWPKIQALGEECPDDAEIQLGIAFLYNTLGAPRDASKKGWVARVGEQEKKRWEQYNKVLRIEPNNPVLWSIMAKDLARGYTGKRSRLVDELEGKVRNARVRHAGEISIYKISPWVPRRLKEEDKSDEVKVKNLYYYLKEVGKKGEREDILVIEDFDLAVRGLREKLDAEAPAVLARLNEGERADGKNALYNYLKAHVYFELGEKEKGLKEIEGGVAKGYLSTYVEEKRKAVARVLGEVDFPEAERKSILRVRRPFEDFLYGWVWKAGLADLAGSCEAKGDFESAEKVYRLALEMADQCQREQYRPVGLGAEAEQRIKGLQRKMRLQGEQSASD